MAGKLHRTDPSQGLQDSRYGRFGLLLGIGVAVAVHLLIFVLPSPKLSAEKEKDTERGMVARAYRPNPLPLPGSGAGASRPAETQAPAPGGKTEVAPLADAAPARISDAPVGLATANEHDVQGATGEVTRGGEQTGRAEGDFADDGGSRSAGQATAPGVGGFGHGGVGGASEVGAGGDKGGVGSGKGQSSDWDRVMSMLADKREELTTREAELKTQREKQVAAVTPKPQAVAKKQEDNFLDPRIRMSVVSYPPTAIEKKFPPVAYPDLRFRRSQVEAGICRVYLRVWTDPVGKIIKTELKTPADKAGQEKYEAFIDEVKKSVAGWPFEPVEAQVHIDVLFEIK